MKYGYSQYAISSDFEDIFFLVRSKLDIYAFASRKIF